MARVTTEDVISITEAARLGHSALIREAEAGHERTVLRNNRPVPEPLVRRASSHDRRPDRTFYATNAVSLARLHGVIH
ncbi:MAG: hypothetical protein IT340_07765 [Chloroflexi bacterium]|nr:hypothetical protein [Chloroflexota bacterium]